MKKFVILAVIAMFSFTAFSANGLVEETNLLETVNLPSETEAIKLPPAYHVWCPQADGSYIYAGYFYIMPYYSDSDVAEMAAGMCS